MNILIADDHEVVRRGLQTIVATQPGWTVAGEASTADEVLPALRRYRFDVLILDIAMRGGRSGMDLLAQIRSEFPSLPVLMLSMHQEEQYAIRCLRAGASGYVQKDSTADELIEAIRRVGAGRRYFSAAVIDQMTADVGRRTDIAPHERLSPREFEVFRALASGRSVGEIAEALHLSVKTVSTHRARILEKTGFRTNADIVAYAIRGGLV